jgi:hypothetical protein
MRGNVDGWLHSHSSTRKKAQFRLSKQSMNAIDLMTHRYSRELCRFSKNSSPFERKASEKSRMEISILFNCSIGIESVRFSLNDEIHSSYQNEQACLTTGESDWLAHKRWWTNNEDREVQSKCSAECQNGGAVSLKWSIWRMSHWANIIERSKQNESLPSKCHCDDSKRLQKPNSTNLNKFNWGVVSVISHKKLYTNLKWPSILK